MAKLNPTVRKETAYIAAWVLILSVIMEAVFLLLRRWEIPVLTGNLTGAVTAVANFLLMAVTVAGAAGGPPEKVAMKVRSSMTARMLGMAAVCAFAVGVLHTNVYATLLPLLFPRIGIAFRPLIDRKRGKNNPDAEGKNPAVPDPEGSDMLD